MTDPQPELDELTDNEVGILKRLIRVELRRLERNRHKAAEKFAGDFDPASFNQKIELLESAYTRLGGDPGKITNRGTSE